MKKNRQRNIFTINIQPKEIDWTFRFNRVAKKKNHQHRKSLEIVCCNISKNKPNFFFNFLDWTQWNKMRKVDVWRRNRFWKCFSRWSNNTHPNLMTFPYRMWVWLFTLFIVFVNPRSVYCECVCRNVQKKMIFFFCWAHREFYFRLDCKQKIRFLVKNGSDPKTNWSNVMPFCV